MRHFTQVTLLAWFLASGALAHADTFLRDVTLVDIETETLAVAQSMLIRDGVIAEVGANIAPAERTEVIDGAGGYLIPGLWDSHVHIFSSAWRSLRQ